MADDRYVPVKTSAVTEMRTSIGTVVKYKIARMETMIPLKRISDISFLQKAQNKGDFTRYLFLEDIVVI